MLSATISMTVSIFNQFSAIVRLLLNVIILSDFLVLLIKGYSDAKILLIVGFDIIGAFTFTLPTIII